MLRRSFDSGGQIESLPIRLFGVVRDSIVDGPGMRYVVFVQGCPHRCPGCHNPGSHSYTGGKLTTTDKIWADIQKYPLTRGITFSGGEPFLWGHELAVLAEKCRDKGLDVMTYTGFTYEHLMQKAETEPSVKELLTVTNYLVDGRYVNELRDLNLHFRGSSNQRILDITCYPNIKSAQQIEL